MRWIVFVALFLAVPAAFAGHLQHATHLHKTAVVIPPPLPAGPMLTGVDVARVPVLAAPLAPVAVAVPRVLVYTPYYYVTPVSAAPVVLSQYVTAIVSR